MTIKQQQNEPVTLAQSSMVDRLQPGRSGLQMSSWQWDCHLTDILTRVEISKASAFHFVPDSQLMAIELF